MEQIAVRVGTLLSAVAMLCACVPVAITAGGIGGSTAVQHTLGEMLSAAAVGLLVRARLRRPGCPPPIN